VPSRDESEPPSSLPGTPNPGSPGPDAPPTTADPSAIPPEPRAPWFLRLKRILLGEKRAIQDPAVFHKVSLIAFLAWVGLGADGLSSSAYGPEEAFKALGPHTYLAPALGLATALTVMLIAYAYSRIIEQFPLGGGGYIVASRLLGRRAGLVSGSALVIDYVLTISISIAAGAEAIFSFLPRELSNTLVLGVIPFKLCVEFSAISFLILLNLRGVKESVTLLTPVFLTFLGTHAILIGGVIVGRLHEAPAVAAAVRDGWSQALRSAPVGIGMVGVAALFLRAYSMGGGTYTGIEAVSNGLTIMREPKVATGRRTMGLMAASLALTAGGLLIAYLLAGILPASGKTMNALLAERFAGGATFGTFPLGTVFILVTLVSEALLLFVAAQAGFIDGPRVMANMAVDSYLPHRFSQLSDRLTMQNGTLLMGGASLLALVYTGGDVTRLVVMYSINVFVTFSLSQLAMCWFWIRGRAEHVEWPKHLTVHGVGLLVCVFILAVTIYEKFGEGGWLTLVLTAILIAFCELIRRHYEKVKATLRSLDDILSSLPHDGPPATAPLDPRARTAVVLVGSYAGLGIHTLLSINRLFPGYFKNYIFASVGVIDSASFTNVAAVDDLRRTTENGLKRYVELARRLGLAADYRLAMGTEAVAEGEELCVQISREFRTTLFFAGKLVFEEERWYQKILHNETAYQIQRRLQFAGLHAMVLPVRVLARARAS
jgi:amino acid transporter